MNDKNSSKNKVFAVCPSSLWLYMKVDSHFMADGACLINFCEFGIANKLQLITVGSYLIWYFGANLIGIDLAFVSIWWRIATAKISSIKWYILHVDPISIELHFTFQSVSNKQWCRRLIAKNLMCFHEFLSGLSVNLSWEHYCGGWLKESLFYVNGYTNKSDQDKFHHFHPEFDSFQCELFIFHFTKFRNKIRNTRDI